MHSFNIIVFIILYYYHSIILIYFIFIESYLNHHYITINISNINIISDYTIYHIYFLIL